MELMKNQCKAQIMKYLTFDTVRIMWGLVLEFIWASNILSLFCWVDSLQAYTRFQLFI